MALAEIYGRTGFSFESKTGLFQQTPSVFPHLLALGHALATVRQIVGVAEPERRTGSLHAQVVGVVKPYVQGQGRVGTALRDAHHSTWVSSPEDAVDQLQ